MSKRKPARPHGRDEVMAAVRASALDLLAQRAPQDISVRDIAAHAGVNHALVHRHFGSKDALLRAVIGQQSAQIGAAMAGREVADALRELREHPAFVRLMARAVLDAPELLEPGSAAAAVLSQLSAPASPDASTRTAAAVAGSLALGWLVFGDHLSATLGVPDIAGFERAVAATIAGVLADETAQRVPVP